MLGALMAEQVPRCYTTPRTIMLPSLRWTKRPAEQKLDPALATEVEKTLATEVEDAVPEGLSPCATGTPSPGRVPPEQAPI
jgi:hypothetical protein